MQKLWAFYDPTNVWKDKMLPREKKQHFYAILQEAEAATVKGHAVDIAYVTTKKESREKYWIQTLLSTGANIL